VLQLQQLEVLQLQQLEQLQLELVDSASVSPPSSTTAGASMPMSLMSSISKVTTSSILKSSPKLVCIGIRLLSLRARPGAQLGF
jgi:hypothetical protein